MCLDHQSTSSYSTANKPACIFLLNQIFGTSAAKLMGGRAGPERAVKVVKAMRSDRMTCRAVAKTSGIFVGPLQKCVNGIVNIANRVGPGTVLSISDGEK